MTRAKKYFGDILSEEAFERKVLPPDPDADFSALMWEAFNGRGKRATKKNKKEVITDDYVFEEVDYSKIRASKRMPRAFLNQVLEGIGANK